MDMKQILAAFDNAGSKPVTGTNDMKRFVSIVQNNSKEVAEGDKEELDSIESHPAADDPRIQKAVADKKKELSTKEEGIHNGLAFKDYFALEEAKKKISAKDDPCWKGYKMVGTKKKGGREVPNCVPGKKGD